jgi:hypothetical protein
MNLLRRIQLAEEARNSPELKKLLSLQEHPTFWEICRFLKHEVARILPDIYPGLYTAPIAGGFVHMSLFDSGPDYIFTADLFNPAADIYTLIALHKLDVDVPCHTAGDIVNGKLNIISVESIRQYGESHKNQILEWLAAGQYDPMFTNEDLLERVKRAASRKHDGGAE